MSCFFGRWVPDPRRPNLLDSGKVKNEFPLMGELGLVGDGRRTFLITGEEKVSEGLAGSSEESIAFGKGR